MDVERVYDHIHKDELVQLALEMGNIPSPRGFEKQAGEFVYEWLRKHGFRTFKQEVVEDRFNVIGLLKGEGKGKSLLFNGHLDTAVGLPEDVWFLGVEPEDIHVKAWIEKDEIVGQSVVNDKGPLAAFLIAAKAVKESGIKLRGDLLLTAVVGEIGCCPIDEFQGPRYLGSGLGSRRLVEEGYVADYAIVAEATDFAVTWTEAGDAFFKITVRGKGGIYTPYIERPFTLEQNPNAIVKMCKVIMALEEWAYDYEKRNTYKFSGGTVVPRVNIGAIRGGLPHLPEVTAGICSIYVDVRLAPNELPLRVENEIRELLEKIGVNAEIQTYMFRPGYEGKNVEKLVEAIEKVHEKECNSKPKKVYTPITSMWRDINVFNEVGIPAVTYGPGHAITDPRQLRGESLKIEDLFKAARIYASLILELCG